MNNTRLKTVVIALALSSSITLTSFNVNASGIPTVDIAALLQRVTDGLLRVQEFEQSIEQARGQLNELRATSDHYKSMVEGHFNFEDVLNDSGLNSFSGVEEWEDAYNDAAAINQYREEFQLFDDDPAVQKRYDRKIKSYALQKKLFAQTQKRAENMKALLDEFDTATTPAAKSDIANSIAYEQTQIANDSAMFASLSKLKSQEAQLELSQRAQASTKKLLHDGYISQF